MNRKSAFPLWRHGIQPLRPAPLPHAHPLGTWGGRRPLPSSRRFRVDVVEGPGNSAGVRIIDRSADSVMFHWTGATARHLLERGFVTDRGWIDKQYVQHLALVAASVEAAHSSHLAPSGSSAARGGGRVGDDAVAGGRSSSTSLQRHVAALLKRYRQHHFSRVEVALLLAIENRPVTQETADRCLDELVAGGELQRIDVPGKNVFFDTDTRPHAHLYDTDGDALHDAHSTDLVMASSGRPVVVLPADERSRPNSARKIPDHKQVPAGNTR